jgi:hypothetical protein
MFAPFAFAIGQEKTEHCHSPGTPFCVFIRVVSQLLRIQMYHCYAIQNSKTTELKITTNYLIL